MFQDRLKPCAAGDRCTLKPMLADPQHKCPTCERYRIILYHTLTYISNISL